MRGIITSSLLALAVGMSGCGGESPASTETARKTATKAQGSHGDNSCAAHRITTPPYRDGACEQNGRHYVIENGRSPVHLRAMTATLLYFTLAEDVRGTTPERGTFLLARLKVQNTSGSPQRFLRGQTTLQFDGKRFEEQTAFERLRKDALGAPGRVIAPGDAIEGVVAYDVAPRRIPAIMRAGLLYVGDFEPQTKASELGVFRLGVASRPVAIHSH